MSLGQRIQTWEDNYFDQLDSVEEDFIERLIKYIDDNYVRGGNIDRQRGRELQRNSLNIANAINRFLDGAGYVSASDDFLGRFTDVELDSLNQLNRTLDLNKKAVEEIFESNPTRRLFLNQTTERLTKTGIGSQYKEGIKNTIIRSVTRGTPFTSLVNELEANYIEKGLLTSRVRTIASDSLSQYNGILNESVEIELDIKHFQYIGGLITTTRPFCQHMTQSMPKIFTNEELQVALDEFIPDGIPSQTRVRNLEGETRAKGSGMIRGTNIGNFSIFRGGHGCRHEKIPVAVTEDEKDRIKRRNQS